MRRPVLAGVVRALRGVALEALVLRGVRFVQEFFEELVGGRVGLEELDVSMTEVGSEEIVAVFGGVVGDVRDGIRMLDLGGSRVGGDAVIALMGMGGLERLSLGWTPAVIPVGLGVEGMSEACTVLAAVIASLPNLVALDLSGSSLELESVLAGSPPRLAELVLSSARVDDVSEMMILPQRLPLGLECLDLSAVVGSARVDLLLAEMGGERPLAALRRLSMARCELRGWDEVSVGAILGQSLLGLRELDVSEIDTLTAEVLVGIVSTQGLSRRLEKLRARGLKVPLFSRLLQASIGYDDCQPDSIYFPELIELDLTDCTLAIDGDALDGVISYFCRRSNIEELHVGGMRHFGYSAVHTALLRCSSTVRSLDLSHCTFPMSNDFSPLLPSFQGLPHLEVLNVLGCFGRIPAAFLDQLQWAAPKLERILHSDNEAIAARTLGKNARRRSVGYALVEAATADKQRVLAQTPWRNRNSL